MKIKATRLSTKIKIVIYKTANTTFANKLPLYNDNTSTTESNTLPIVVGIEGILNNFIIITHKHIRVM